MAGKKFRFSLDRVLTLRGHQADRAQQDVERASGNVVAQAKVVRALQQRLDDLTASTTGSLADLRHRDAFRQQLQNELDVAQAKLVDLKNVHAQKQVVHIAKYREKETLITLRTGERAKHRKAVQEAENAFLDEQATLGHARRAETHAAR